MCHGLDMIVIIYQICCFEYPGYDTISTFVKVQIAINEIILMKKNYASVKDIRYNKISLNFKIVDKTKRFVMSLLCQLVYKINK